MAVALIIGVVIIIALLVVNQRRRSQSIQEREVDREFQSLIEGVENIDPREIAIENRDALSEILSTMQKSNFDLTSDQGRSVVTQLCDKTDEIESPEIRTIYAEATRVAREIVSIWAAAGRKIVPDGMMRDLMKEHMTAEEFCEYVELQDADASKVKKAMDMVAGLGRAGSGLRSDLPTQRQCEDIIPLRDLGLDILASWNVSQDEQHPEFRQFALSQVSQKVPAFIENMTALAARITAGEHEGWTTLEVEDACLCCGAAEEIVDFTKAGRSNGLSTERERSAFIALIGRSKNLLFLELRRRPNPLLV